MAYVIIILALLLVMIYVYKKENDLLCPSIVYATSMFTCCLCALVGVVSWNDVGELGILTVLIVLLSVLSFACGNLLFNYLINNNIIFKKRKNVRRNNNRFIWLREYYKKNIDKFIKIKNNYVYDTKPIIIAIELLIVLITIFFMYKEVRRIAIIAGYDGIGFGNMISKFRELSILYTTELVENGKGINIFVSQMRKICEVICTFNIFLIVQKIVKKEKFDLKLCSYIFIVFLCIFLSLFTGGRMQIFIYVLSFALLYLFYIFDYKCTISMIKKHAKKIMIAIVVLLLGFYVILPLSGRKTNSNIVNYMSFYFGTSIPSLEKYNGTSHPAPSYFGEETLRGINTVLFKIGLNDKITPISKEWYDFSDKDGNIYSSNIFTSGKRYYHDFGVLGIFVCQMIFGFVFSLLYYYSKRSNFVLVFYSMYFYMCIDQVRDELFFSEFVHINTVFKFMILLLLFLTLKVCKKGKKKYEK